jgi:ABC-type transport system involved in cytochrome c biogenesis permease subunit
VTTVLSQLAAPDVTASPAGRFTPIARLAAAGTLVLGAAFQLASFLTIPSHDETAERLRWVADHAARAELSKVFDILAMPFLLGTAVVYLLLSRERARRLAWAGGLLLALGMVGLSAIQGVETLEFALATDGRFELAALADAVDNISTAPAAVLFVMFIGGALFGLVISSVALWRSQAVPRAAVLLIPLFILVDFFLSRPIEAHVISFVAALWIASAVLRAGRGGPAPRS